MNITTITPAIPTAQPEFVDAKGLRTLYGICRSHAYELAEAGKIRSFAIRRPGAVRGRRLFDCASIRAYFSTLCENKEAA